MFLGPRLSCSVPRFLPQAPRQLRPLLRLGPQGRRAAGSEKCGRVRSGSSRSCSGNDREDPRATSQRGGPHGCCGSVWRQLEFCVRAPAVPGASGVAGVAGVVSNPWGDGRFFPSLSCLGDTLPPQCCFHKEVLSGAGQSRAAGGLSAPLSTPGLGCRPWVPPPCEGVTWAGRVRTRSFPERCFSKKTFLGVKKHFYIKTKLMHCGAEGIS